MGNNLKRGAILIVAVMLVSTAFCQEENATQPVKPKRIFSGSGNVNLGSYENFFIRVVGQQKLISGEPGETVHFKLFLRRGDDETVAHDIRIIGDDPALPLTVIPEVTPELRNIDMYAIKASIAIPAETPHGRYPVKIKISGKEFVEEPYPLDLTLEVGDHANIWNYLYWAIAAVLCALVFIRVRALKRAS